MQLKNYNVYFFFLLLIGVSVLAYFILQSFAVPFLIAIILAHLFGFIYRTLLKFTKNKKGLSSGLTCLLVALIIIVPISFVSSLVVAEIQDVIVRIVDKPVAIRDTLSNVITNLAAIPVFKTIEVDKLINQEAVISGIKSFSQNALGILQSTYQGVAHFIFVSFVMFFSLFYLFIDGDKLIKKIMQLSPLQDKYETMLVEKFNSITRATIKGTSLIAIVQGLLGGTLFFFVGVSSPVLLGILMTISSVIPSIGSGLVWLPVGLSMLLLGHFTQGLVIIIIGGLVISTIDNIIRPKLVGKDTQMHPLLILFSTLGGIALFGLSGFIVGPIIMSLFVALWEIYSLEFKTQLREFNQ